MTFIPSPQQAAFFDWIKNGKGNAFLEAVAGAGKTTSLLEGAKFMNGTIAMLAFNKKIAAELKEKSLKKGLTNVDAGTFHSFGFQAWKRHTDNKYIKVDSYKIKNIMKELEVHDDWHPFVRKLVSLAKQSGFGFTNKIHNRNDWMEIVDHHLLDMDLKEKMTPEKGIEYAIEVLQISNDLGNKIIDFDDMIYLPVLHQIKMFTRQWILVDEAQDTNPVRREMVKMMSWRNTRVVWVGDRHQAIYGFTGADSDAVDEIISDFKCQPLPLTVTYRCPKAVVTAAQNYVSHITAHESAPEGATFSKDRVAFEEVESLKLLKKDDAILCRNTKPAVELAYKLIRHGIACHVEGRDIGENMIKMLGKWKVKTVDKFLERLEKWEATQVQRAIDKGNDSLVESIHDQAETLRVICDGCHTVLDAVAKVHAMFEDTEPGVPAKNITLSTVHKSKGREWNDVYILGFQEYMPSKFAKLKWQKEQENNLIYVAITRAQKSLTFVG